MRGINNAMSATPVNRTLTSPQPSPLPRRERRGRNISLRLEYRVCARGTFEGHPLIPSFSPSGGEGARRAVEGVGRWNDGFSKITG
jgi:hypothetical protein